MSEEYRWEFRFKSFLKAFNKLNEAVERLNQDFPPDNNGSIAPDDFLDDIIKEGIIQRFEYTHELAWNVMKDFLLQAGNTNIYGSKDATREAFAANLITNGDVWMEMIISRNRTSHTYNEETADAIFSKIMKDYVVAFRDFRKKMEPLLNR